MHRHIMIIAFCLTMSGCQHMMLKQNTLRQASTIADLQYQQVLSNLAMLSNNPDSLPHFAAIGTSTTNINRTAQANAGFNWDLIAGIFRFDKSNLGVQGQQANLEQWTASPILNPDELDLMRCVYLRTLGLSTPEIDDKLKNFFLPYKPDSLEAMTPGWYGVGGKHKVPKQACLVGQYCDTYVWVIPGGQENLTKVTLAILDIATSITGSSPVMRLDPLRLEISAIEASMKALNDSSTGVSDPLAKKKLQERLNAQALLLSKKLEELEAREKRQALEKLKRHLETLHADSPLPESMKSSLKINGFDGQARVGESLNVINEELEKLPYPTTPLPVMGRERKNLYNPFQLPIYGPQINN